MPDFTLEAAAGGRVAGVDEVGRGPLAGPVLAAAVVLPSPPPPALTALLDDSKRLSAAQRARAAAALRACGAELALGAASVAEIARLNILGATLLAMARAVARLPSPPDLALVDGNRAPPLDCPLRCVVGGDGRSLSIAAASIIAKLARDRAMARLAARWPGYGWEANAGYGTAAHRAALARLGATPHHRAGFGTVRRVIAASG
jgi:ribonuclease HII